MEVVSSKSASSTALALPGKPRVEWSLIPDKASAPLLADQIVQYFENIPGCYMVVAFVPKDAAKFDARRACGVVASLPDGRQTPEPVGARSAGGKALGQTFVGGHFTFGDVKVNFAGMEACHKGRPVSLRVKEFKTLTYFVQNAGRVISRDELLNEVWGYECYPCTRTVDNHILQLRRKLEAVPSRPKHFLTVHGAGYKFLP